jgi:hypothetical protein
MYFAYGARVGIEDLAVGDVIVYHAFGGEVRRVAIRHVDEDIKNGRSGFGGVLIDSDNKAIPFVSIGTVTPTGVWGYVSQILWHTGERVVFDDNGNIL